MRGRKGEEAFHEPAWSSNRSLPWESGAEDARTPNADASSADSVVSAKRLECVRFIVAFRHARDGQRFMAAMHGRKAEEAFPDVPSRASSGSNVMCNCSRQERWIVNGVSELPPHVKLKTAVAIRSTDSQAGLSR